MRTLTFGFYGEGIRDYRFTRLIVERSFQRMIPHVDVQSIEIDVRREDRDQIEVVLEIARRTHGFDLAVIHLDADSSTEEKAYDERYRPAFEAVQSGGESLNSNLLPVIPIRMTEAWMLVDFAAFKAVSGTSLAATDLDFPQRPEAAERLPDPKEIFESAVRQARPGKRRPIPPADVYLPLAERIDLARLEKLRAYYQFVARARRLLTDLHFVEG
jgi:hypothetical protein